MIGNDGMAVVAAVCREAGEKEMQRAGEIWIRSLPMTAFTP